MTEYIRAKSDKKTKEERETGKFYTINNPFTYKAFDEWYIQAIKDTNIILEPFAGGNNIPRLIKELNLPQKEWHSYDINPTHKDVIKQDTFKDYPKGYKTVITNPPYLSRSVATQRKINYPDTEYNDMYKYALSLMLKYNDYIAAIIPDSFVNSKEFKDAF